MPLVGEVPPPPPPASKRAPRTPSTSTSSKKLVDQHPSQAAERAKSLMELAGIAQGIALMTGNYADAETIEMHAGNFLTAVAKLGDVHPQFGESLDATKNVSPYVAVFAAAVPMALQFMANHNRIDSAKLSFGGIKNPKVLADRQAAKVMNANANMIAEQREAEMAARDAQARLQAEVQAMQSLAEEMIPA